MQCKISVNQLADFVYATESKKMRIVRQQKEPNQLKIAWYQLAKARMKKAIQKNGDLSPILDGLKELKNRKITKQRQIQDRQVSIEAMEKFIRIKLPVILKEFDYEVLKKPKINSLVINGVEVIVAPDVIVRIKVNNQYYLGAVKIHVSKNNIFDRKQSKYISSLIYKYLNDIVASGDELVMKELCLSIDVFGERVIKSPKNISKSIRDIEVICSEVKSFWDAA